MGAGRLDSESSRNLLYVAGPNEGVDERGVGPFYRICEHHSQ